MSRLIADIGGTSARFGIADGEGIRDIRVLPCNEYPSPAAAARAYLGGMNERPDTGAFAVATPVNGADRVAMTNHVWDFSIEETRAEIGLDSLRVINDFTALAFSVPYLAGKDLLQVGGEEPRREGYPMAIIGPGTGLGVAAVVFNEGKPVPVTTEGGHVTMSAATLREYTLFEWLRLTKYHHISAERVCSGKGLVNLYMAICGVDGLELPEKTPQEITSAALGRSCRVCMEALDLFCSFLGVAAGNLALSYGAFGGVYIAGGIVPRLGNYFADSRFRASFEYKGRFKEYVQKIPAYVVTHPYPGLEGLRHLA